MDKFVVTRSPAQRSPSIHVDLADENVGGNRVIRLMQAEGLDARARRRYWMRALGAMACDRCHIDA